MNKKLVGALVLFGGFIYLNKKPAKKDPIIYIDVLEPAPDDRTGFDPNDPNVPIAGGWKNRL